jgi:hypothetical protein
MIHAMLAGKVFNKVLGRDHDPSRTQGTTRIGGATKVGAAVLVLGGVGSGFLSNCEGMVETSSQVEGGKATILDTYSLQNTTYGGMDVLVEDATARIDHKVDITGPLPGGPIDVGAWALAEYNGVVSAEVRVNDDPEKAQAEREIDFSGDRPHITLTVPSEAFSTIVYEKNPSDSDSFRDDKGAAWALFDGFADLVDGLPGHLRVSGSDETGNVLRSLARGAAYYTATEGCADEVWPHLDSIIEENMIAEIVDDHNFYNRDEPKDQLITAADVTVILPSAEEIQLPDQYQNWREETKAEFEKAGVNLTMPKPEDLKCEPSTKLTEVQQ